MGAGWDCCRPYLRYLREAALALLLPSSREGDSQSNSCCLGSFVHPFTPSWWVVSSWLSASRGGQSYTKDLCWVVSCCSDDMRGWRCS